MMTTSACNLSSINREREDYFIHQFNTSCLSQFSYYIESDKQAIIIDPIIDSDIYIKMLNQRGATLKHILETHFHADFVSGHVELARLTDATVVFGPNAITQYKSLVAYSGELIRLGKITVEVIHTPGHTMESTSYLIRDSNSVPREIFTGDCLFLGEVGRPDLAVASDVSQTDLAGYLYDSLQKLKALPDDVIVFPGHGAGSACGKRISQGSSDTLGNQKKTNYALNENLKREEFIEIVTSNLSPPPLYFFHDVILNKNGYPSISESIEKSLNPIPPHDFFQILSKNVAIVLDTRDHSIAIKSFIKGSYLISLKMNYAIWAATLFKPQQTFIIIADTNKEREAISRLSRVGFLNVTGFVEGGYENLVEYSNKQGLMEYIVSSEILDPAILKQVMEAYIKTGEVEFIDVREKSEWLSTGILRNSHLYAASTFEDRIEELMKVGTEKKYAVFCKSGQRATIVVSIMKKYGFENVINIGGTQQMIENGIELKAMTD